MGNFKSLLAEFEGVLKKYNPENFSRLEGPLPEPEINGYLKTIGINDDDFNTLYQWTNGFDIRSGDFCEVTCWGTFLSLEYIVFSVTELGPLHRQGWPPHFIPFMADYDEQFLLFNNESGPDYGKIHLFSVSEFSIQDPFSIFDSLLTMVQSDIEAYKRGIYTYLPGDDMMECDYKKYREMARPLNKGSIYWNR